MFINLIERQYLINRVDMFGVRSDITNGNEQYLSKKENKKIGTSFKSVLEDEVKKLDK